MSEQAMLARMQDASAPAQIRYQRCGDVSLMTVEGDATLLNSILVDRLAVLEREAAGTALIAGWRGDALALAIARLSDCAEALDAGDLRSQALADLASHLQRVRDAVPESPA